MDNKLILEIVVGMCFIALIIVLFIESKDYLTYSLLFIFIVIVSTYTLITPPEDEKEQMILAIDWEVIVFLFCLFCIVEILNEKRKIG